MERWVSYAFGPLGEKEVEQLRRALDYCLGREIETALRLLPSLRPLQVRRLCLFLSGLSDKEVAALTGEEVGCIKVARFRLRRSLSASGAEGRAIAARISRLRCRKHENGKWFKLLRWF